MSDVLTIAETQLRFHILERHMSPLRITKLIGYGILIFVLGFILGLLVHPAFQLLLPLGSVATYTGVFLYFRQKNVFIALRREQSEDVIFYFFNKIILKLWVLVFMAGMLAMNLMLIDQGFLR